MGTPSGMRQLIVMIFVAFVMTMSQAQEKTTAAPPGVLESVPAKVTEFEKELTDKVDATRTALDKEVAANRLKDSVAQTLRWSLRTSAITFSGNDIRGVLATSRVPFENAAVAAACKELETTWVGIQARYTDLQKEAVAESRQRAVESIKSATQPEQVDQLIQAIEKAQSALQRKSSWSGATDPGTNLSSTIGALRSLRRLVESEASGNLRSIVSAMGSMQQMGPMDRDGAIDGELRARVEKIRAPYLKKIDDAQAALDAALEARKPAAEVSDLLDAFSEALEQANQLRSGFEYHSGRDVSGTLAMYRAALDIIRSMESKDYATAQQQIRNARNTNVQTEGRRSPKVAALLAKWEEQVQIQETHFIKDQVQSWRSRIQKVNRPADLDDLIVEITRAEQRGRSENRKVELPAGLSSTLSTLAAAWRSMNPGFLRDERMQAGSSEERQGPLATELATLRRKIQREVMVGVLKVPELNQPPLSEKSPQEAVEELVRQSAQKKDWRRVIEVLQAWRPLNVEGTRGDAELVDALRSYLAGQNLELAEQWSDAAAAYKRVLLCTSELAPVADAAERLKTLKKDHPESVSPPIPTGRPQLRIGE